MAVNTAIYGNETDWVPFFGAGSSWKESAIPKLAAFRNESGTISSYLDDAVKSGLLTINNEIDKSISFSAVDDGSWLCNQSWYYINKTKVAEPASDIVEVCKLQKHSVNPLAFFIKGTYGNSSEMPYCNASNYAKQFFGFEQVYTSNNGNLKMKPVTYISVKDMVYVVMVRAVDTDPETMTPSDSVTTVNYDLYTYMKYTESDGKHIYEKYPWVICLYLIPLYSRPDSYSGSDLRSPVNSSSVTSIQPAVMNSFETGINPYIDEEDKPLKILSYYQIIGQSGNDSGFRAALPLTDPTKVPRSYSTSYRPVVIAGSRTLWTNPTPDYMFLLSNVCKYRHLLDGNNIKWCHWLEKVDNSNSIEVYEKYMKQAAYFGAFFTDSYDYAVNATTWDIEHTFIGSLDENGVAHGEYTEGTENRKQKQWEWNDWSDTPYDPSKRPDAPDKEQESDPFTFSGGNPHGLMSGNYYAITTTELSNLQNWINKLVNPDGQFYDPNTIEHPDNSYSPEALAYAIERMFSGVYPNDCIINLQYFPFDIVKLTNYGGATNLAIKLGNTTTMPIENWYGTDRIAGAYAAPLGLSNTVTQYAVINTPDYYIDEYFGDFRDYQPYTTMELLVPWHGTIPLDPGHWYGHNLSTKMVVDLITGTSTTYILRDGIAIQSIDGQVGYTINFSIRNVGDFSKTAIATSQEMNMQKYDNAKTAVNTVTGTVSGMTVGIGAAMTGNVSGVAGAIGGVANGIISLEQGKQRYKNLEFALGHCPSGSTLVSAQCPAVSQYANEDLRLVIKRPHLISGYNSSIYGKTVGFACNIQDKISSFNGYTVFSGANIDGIPATEQEKQMIYASLQQGVII